MNPANFDYKGALDAGYSEDEINQFLQKEQQQQKPKQDKNNKFDVEGALQAGYSQQEIDNFLESQKPETSMLQKAGRIASQYAIGGAEAALLPYEALVAPLAIPGGQEAIQDLFTREILSDVYPTESEGKQVGPRELSEPINLGVRGLVEKATGIDFHPEGILEKAANWSGFLKNPRKLKDLAKSGLTAKDAAKAISPSATESIRGVGAGAALQAAEEGDFGPIGTIAAAVIGDIGGMGVAGAAKSAKMLIKKPKKVLSEAAAKFTPKEKIELQKEIIKDFREAGIQADLGTITDSNLVKWTQSRMAQSGLTGKSLAEFRDNLTKQIKEEYKSLADSLGESRFLAKHEAGEAAREGIKAIREADLAATRKLYTEATKALKEGAVVETRKLATAIENLEKELKPGAIKSTEQQTVLNTIDKLKKDIYTEKGTLKLADVKELMNNKIALNDIINYEVQGGSKQLLKSVVAEIDRAIISHGKQNIPFVRNYISANKKFSEHAKIFRNKTAKNMMNAEDPAQLMNKMNSVQGIRSLGKILDKTPEGKTLFNNLKRHQLEKVVGDNLVDSTTQQVKLGTFSKLLEKGKNREVIKEVLGAQAFKRLERLQKNAGRLAEAAQKFYNSSQSGASSIDAAILAKGIGDIANLLSGNPWPLMKLAGGMIGARRLSGLLSDPEFLKLTEEVILASEKGTKQDLIISVEKLKPYILPILQDNN